MNGLSIVIPVFNEELFLKTGLEPLIAGAEAVVADLELLVVDDGSGGRCKALLEELRRNQPLLRVVAHQDNRGYGAALRTGIANTRKDWLLFIDGDGQMDIRDLKKFWDSRDSLDFILGYRARRRDAFLRRLAGAAGNTLANLFLPGERIRDINCGFKLFRTEAVRPLRLRSCGGAIYFEMLSQLLPSRPRFLQLPVSHSPRAGGRATGGSLKTLSGIAVDSAAALMRRGK